VVVEVVVVGISKPTPPFSSQFPYILVSDEFHGYS